MRKSNHKAIRKLLIENSDGMTATSIAKTLGLDSDAVTQALKTMVDAYKDRWEKSTRKFVPVWCVQVIPEDCPHPLEDL